MRSFRHRRAHPRALLRRNRSRGLSLLEVILAITILGGSLVLVGELIRIGFRSAAEAKLQSEAQIHCDAKMAEIAAGVLPLESSGGNSIEEDPSWVYAVEIENADQIGLLRVRVTVEQSPDVSSYPASFSVIRLIPDPDYEPPQPVQQ